MNSWISPLVGGAAGTAVMTIALFLPYWLGFGRVDITRAVGALITRRAQNGFLPGLVLHFTSGIIFAYLYKIILMLSFIPLNALTGMMMGALHGAIIMILVSIAIMEHHPIALYHTRGPMTGFAQLLAHILYGFVVGYVAQLMG